MIGALGDGMVLLAIMLHPRTYSVYVHRNKAIGPAFMVDVRVKFGEHNFPNFTEKDNSISAALWRVIARIDHELVEYDTTHDTPTDRLDRTVLTNLAWLAHQPSFTSLCVYGPPANKLQNCVVVRFAEHQEITNKEFGIMANLRFALNDARGCLLS